MNSVKSQAQPVQRREVRVTFASGNTIETSINGTEQEIRSYYLGNKFNLGAEGQDDLQVATSVEFL